MTSLKRWIICILSTSSLLMGCATQPHSIPLPAIAAPYATVTPKGNAQPDDTAWQHAATINELSHCDRKATSKLNPTVVKVLWDKDYLYVRFICEDDQIFTPHAKTRDGRHHQGDVVEVFIDPIGDGRQYVEVQVNPVGGVLDVLHMNTTSQVPSSTPILPREDWPTNHWGVFEWDMPELRTASSTHWQAGKPVQWISDFAIPAKTLLRRLAVEHFEPMQMRINFLRCDGPADLSTHKRTRLIASSWAFVPTGLPHLAPGSMGIITLTDK
ncbi:MAG TPA: hypothetical protein DCM28_04760 [Phycisphaerales bacterium]|nr:hypothetical protein [Phycisphaerales bacterium]